MTITTIPATRNEGWGFYGTTSTAGQDAAATWAAAFAALRDAVPGAHDNGIRDFLDSRLGRHFADTMLGNMQVHRQPLDVALAETIAEWEGWKITRRIERELDIPAGLPYLTGWVLHFDIADEMSETGAAS